MKIYLGGFFYKNIKSQSGKINKNYVVLKHIQFLTFDVLVRKCTN